MEASVSLSYDKQIVLVSLQWRLRDPSATVLVEYAIEELRLCQDPVAHEAICSWANGAGILLDTGPIVALLSKDDAQHQRASEIFSECEPPFRRCEAVVAEACFLMRNVFRRCRPDQMRRSFCRTRIPTFDPDFRIYRWKRTQRFEVMS